MQRFGASGLSMITSVLPVRVIHACTMTHLVLVTAPVRAYAFLQVSGYCGGGWGGDKNVIQIALAVVSRVAMQDASF